MPDSVITASALALTKDVVQKWANKDPANPNDDQFWEGGEWVAGLPRGTGLLAYRQGGPAMACAVARKYWRTAPAGVTPDTYSPFFKAIAEQTVDYALSAAGRTAIGYPGTTGTPDALETMMFMQDLGVAILMLDGDTAVAKIDVWKQAYRDGADLVLQNIDWYANGNINLGYTLVVYMAKRILGDAKYDWRSVLQKAKTPVTHSGADPARPYGLEVENSRSWQIGYDGCGYFTEQKMAGWPNGYDGEYTMVQMDVLARLAVLTGDPDVTDLLNMVLNKTLARTDFTSWNVNCGLGTRHTSPDWQRLLTSPVLHVVEDLGRPIPLDVRLAQWAKVEADFRSTSIFLRPNQNYYKGLGGWVGMVALADLVSRGVVAQTT